MDDEQRQKHAPRRNRRYGRLRSFDEDADWADTLDWKTNDYDFYRLFQSLLARLDSEYREWCGMRIDQLVSREDLLALARSAASHYQEQEQIYHTIGIYLHVYHRLSDELGARAGEVIDARQVSGFAASEI